MATKGNRTRYRRFRSAILSASILSFIPVVGLIRMEAANGYGADTVDPMTAVADSAPVTEGATASSAAVQQTASSTVMQSSGSQMQTQAAASSATQAQMRQGQMASSSSYTRTKAS